MSPSNNKRLNRLTAGLALAFALIVLGLSLYNFDFQRNREVVHAIFDFGHLGLYLILSFALTWSGLLARFPGEWLLSIVGCNLFSIAIEAVQPFFNRDSSWRDVLYGTFGAILGTSLAVALRKRRALPVYAALGGMALLFGALSFHPVIAAWKLIQHRTQQFPVLGTFEDEKDLSLWLASGKAKRDISKDYSAEGKGSLRVVFPSGDFSGVVFVTGVQDWREYDALVFEAFNRGDQFGLKIRIDDTGETRAFDHRFNDTIPIKRGWQTVRIPIEYIKSGPVNRELRMDRVRRLLLFYGKDSSPRTVFFDNVRLVK